MVKVTREDLGPHLCSILGCESVTAKRYSKYGDVSHRDVWLCDDCAKQIGKLAGSKSAEKAEAEAEQAQDAEAEAEQAQDAETEAETPKRTRRSAE